jgi:hypothetical protein
LDDWAVGGALFENAVNQAKLAQRISKLEGILWHQGENDCFPERVNVYAEKFGAIVDAFRSKLNVPDIPLIIGGLGDFLTSGMYGKYFEVYPLVNQALQEFAKTQSNCYFVTASGLTANPDGLHFNAASQRIFGIRYFEAFDHRQHITEPLSNEDNTLQLINDRPLTSAEKVMLLEYKFASGELSVEDYNAQLSIINK